MRRCIRQRRTVPQLLPVETTSSSSSAPGRIMQKDGLCAYVCAVLVTFSFFLCSFMACSCAQYAQECAPYSPRPSSFLFVRGERFFCGSPVISPLRSPPAPAQGGLFPVFARRGRRGRTSVSPSCRYPLILSYIVSIACFPGAVKSVQPSCFLTLEKSSVFSSIIIFSAG